MAKVNEIWLPIDGTNGAYEISNHGRVKSYRVNDRLLKLQLVNGYLMVPLNIDNKKKFIKVHRLVASAFIPNPELKSSVNHKDGDKTNNLVSNLEWCTHKENMQHAYKNRLRDNRGQGNPSAKLTNDDALLIYSSKNTCMCLAAMYGVSVSTISRIKRGEKWSHVTKSTL